MPIEKSNPLNAIAALAAAMMCHTGALPALTTWMGTPAMLPRKPAAKKNASCANDSRKSWCMIGSSGTTADIANAPKKQDVIHKMEDRDLSCSSI
jgi:hypothetical protein